MYSEVLSLVEKIVRHPLYHLLGIASNRLVYQSTLEGTTDLWSMPIEGGEATLLARRFVDISKPRYNDDKIFYTLDIARGKELHKIYLVDVEGGENYEAFEMEPVRIMGLTHIDDKVAYSGASQEDNAIYLSEVDGKASKVYSTKNFIFVSDMNDKYVIGAGLLAGNPQSMEIFIYSLENNELRVYTPKEGSTNMPSMIHENKILFSSNYEGEKKLYLYDIENDALLEPKFEGSEYTRFRFNDYQSYGFTFDGKIWFIGLSDYRGYAFLDGYNIYHPPGTPLNIEVYKDSIFMTFSSLKTPYSIYKTGFYEDEWRKIIGEELDKEVLDRLGDVEILKYKSFDNLEIPMIVYTSKRDKPGPTVLYVHGGPWSHVGDFWSVFIAALVANGFHVVAPNFRGSTGYGEDFRRLDIGDPGGGDLKDIVYAREYAVKNGLASKIAIMGYSYGGFMTYLATVKYPDLWDAGVAGAGVVDWEMMYELADAAFKYFQEMLFAGNNELKKDRSAIHFVDRLKAPLCILHPQNDTRTPLKPVLKYMDKLIEYGKIFEAHIYPDMGHMITDIEDALKLVYPAIIFLKKTLG